MAAKTKSEDSTLVNMLLATVVLLVAGLLLGGYWINQQRSHDAQYYEQARTYEHYLQTTRTPSKPVELPRSFVEAQQTRQHLLAHPAVTPGAGFDAPGVQSTGKAIVDAIDQARGL